MASERDDTAKIEAADQWHTPMDHTTMTISGEALWPVWMRIGNLDARVRALERDSSGHKRRIPWMQLAAMGTVAVSSLLGIITPDKAAAILRALFH